MNINALIDSLMIYAQENLLLDDYDLIYSRNRIINLLNISDYEEYEIDAEMIDGMQNPYQILSQISSYAVTSGIIEEQKRAELETDIMSYLLKRPSEIADMFCDLCEQGKVPKAFMWLSEYNHRSGFIKFHNILKHWEAKGTKGKIEVFIASSPNEPEFSRYPASNKCAEIDGYKKYKTLRRAPLQLGKKTYFWQFEENPYVSGLGYGIAPRYEQEVLSAESLGALFDFVELAPSHFAALFENETNGYFVGAPRQLPLHKAPELRKCKSQEYPYINISEVDWYTNVLRFSCTNREKLMEFTLKIAGAFKAASEGNMVGVSLRKTDKFVVELMLIDSKLEVSESCRNLIEQKPDSFAQMGIFVLNETLFDEIKQMDMYLTKESKFTDASLSDNMKKHKNMIAKMLKEIGSTKISSVEAQIDIKEEINNICESALTDVKALNTERLNDFLEGVGIK